MFDTIAAYLDPFSDETTVQIDGWPTEPARRLVKRCMAAGLSDAEALAMVNHYCAPYPLSEADFAEHFKYEIRMGAAEARMQVSERLLEICKEGDGYAAARAGVAWIAAYGETANTMRDKQAEDNAVRQSLHDKIARYTRTPLPADNVVSPSFRKN